MPVTSQSVIVGHDACQELMTGTSWGKVVIEVEVALGTSVQQTMDFVDTVSEHLCPQLTQ